MTPSSSLAALFAALAQSGYSKATQSRATKHGVGLGGKPRCDRAKQQNDPFVLRSQPCRRGNAASSVRFPHAISLPRSRSSAALKLTGALAMLFTTAMPRKKPSKLYVTHLDRHVMTGDSKATICRDHHAVTRKGRKWCHSLVTRTS